MNQVLAIVGMSGSGKSVASCYLEEKGYTLIYFGGVIYDKMRSEGIEITPESTKEFRENLRKEHGMGVVAKILLPKIKEAVEEGNVVLDGLYSWEEYKLLKDVFPQLKMIAIVSDKEIRYERVSKRVERPFNREEIISRDIAEIENSAKGGPIAYADYYLFNNFDLETYKKRMDEIIKLCEEESM